MAGLDIVSLYSSVSMQEVLQYINAIVDNISNLSQDIKTSIKSGLNLIVYSTIFIVNKIVYQQIHGAPMGSPVSGLFAKFALRPVENKIFDSFNLKQQCWLRYIDDALILWKNILSDLTNFLRDVNRLIHNIKFALEIDENSQLPFLDV